MKVITTASEMLAFSSQNKAKGSAIAFVPTMGALHDGHISLVEAAKREKTRIVVSVFVNPTQFNEQMDLDSYPRTFESDKLMLQDSNVDVMFFPSVEEVYPEEISTEYEMDGLDAHMEGPNRPGHFNGVVQVVSRLFDMVEPDFAFFGEKDFQQLAIIRHMMGKLGYKAEIVGCPTVRESSGLAMSSRNARLSTGGSNIAVDIHKTLLGIKQGLAKGQGSAVTLKKAIDDLNKNIDIELEYLELVDPTSLKSANDENQAIQACIAAWVEGVRLIDNMRVK